MLALFLCAIISVINYRRSFISSKNTDKGGEYAINLNHIYYAIEIAHYGSFNKAAANLFVSQPGLSRSIKELEEELGFQLFFRTPSGVLPTHQGQEFLQRAKRLNEQYLALSEQYFTNNHLPVIQFSLASFRCVIVEFALINLYNRYKDNEYLNICVCEESIEKVINHIYDGLYSIGLILVSNENRNLMQQKCEHLGICWTPIAKPSAYVQVGTEHPLTQKESVCLADLAPYPRATMAQDEMEPTLYGTHVHGYSPQTLKSRIVINDKSTMYALLTNTDAYYTGLNLSNLRRGNHDVCYLPIRDLNSSYELVLIHLNQHTLTTVEEEFLADIRSIAGTVQ